MQNGIHAFSFRGRGLPDTKLLDENEPLFDDRSYFENSDNRYVFFDPDVRSYTDDSVDGYPFDVDPLANQRHHVMFLDSFGTSADLDGAVGDLPLFAQQLFFDDRQYGIVFDHGRSYFPDINETDS